jgi:hypothetical protein
MEGAISIAGWLAGRCPANVESILCSDSDDSIFINVTDENSVKQPYLLVPYDKSRKQREQQVFAAAVEKAVADALAARGSGDRVLPGALSAHDLASYRFDTDAVIEDDQVIYDGLLSLGDIAVWIGREKARKSNFLLVLAICAAVGRDFLSFKFMAKAAMRIVIIDFESKNRSLKRRYDSIADAMKLTAEERALLKQNLNVIEVRRIRKSGVKFPKFPYKPDPEGLKFWDALVMANSADLYIIDPFRSLHGGDENDSMIESMLTELQRVFRGATLIVAHHMRKAGDNARNLRLADDMRAWSDGVRGSSAIKASADVIVCQEWMPNANGDEVVHLGAFLKDGADIEPFPLIESDHNSFFWERTQNIPAHLTRSVTALGTGTWANKTAAAAEILKKAGIGRATAFRHVEAMIRAKILTELTGGRLERKPGAASEQAA